MTDVMPNTDVAQAPDFGNLGEDRKPIPFKIDEEVFYGVPDQPAGVLFDMAAMVDSKDMAQQVNLLSLFLQSMLVPESFERLKARMSDPGRPVTLRQILKITEYLMEQYTGRPTQQSSPS